MIESGVLNIKNIIVVAVGSLFLLTTSGILIIFAISYISTGEEADIDVRYSRAGNIVGKCENILVLIFVFSGEYTALAVIFAAEEIISLEYETKSYGFVEILLN